MSKNITISEGDTAKVFTGVKKISTAKSGGSGFVDWVPEDEAIDYVDLDSLDVDENGTYTPANEGCQAFSRVSVNVQPDLTTKGIDANGTYNASDDGADGYNSVVVDVQPDLTTKEIDANGTYNASDDGADGYDSVVVDVQPNVSSVTIKRNGTFRASDANLDGYDKVIVNVPGNGGPISGVQVNGIAVNNLSAGQSVHVYQNDVTTETGITVYPRGTGGWVVGDDFFFCQYGNQLSRKSASNISEDAPSEDVLPSNLLALLIAFPFICYKDGGNNIYLTSFFDLSKRTHVANNNYSLGIQQGNGYVVIYYGWLENTQAELYDSGLNKIASFICNANGTDPRPLDASRYINARGFNNGLYSFYSITTLSGETKYYNTGDDEMGIVTQLGEYVYFAKAASIYRVPLGQTVPTLVFTMDYETRPTIRCSDGFNHSNANGYFLVSTDKETYRVNSDGSFRKLPIVVDASVCFTGMDTGFISRASESIYNDGLTYYPFGDGGTYIQGTGSKGASGQLGVAKSSASAGSTATAIVLFS